MRDFPFSRALTSRKSLNASLAYERANNQIYHSSRFKHTHPASGNSLDNERVRQTITLLDLSSRVQEPVRCAEFCDCMQNLQAQCHTTSINFINCAIRTNHIALDFQPVVYTESRQLVGVEVLVHWHKSFMNHVLSDHIVNHSESSGLVGWITNWILQASFQKASEWWAQGARMHVFINIPLQSFLNCKLIDRLTYLCSEYDTSPDWITLGINECALTQNPMDILGALCKIRDKGFHLSIDDFGLGNSSITQLLHLPFSEIKIDQSYVNNLHLQQKAAIVLRALIRLSQELDLRVLAEGVESQDDLDLLRLWQCPLAKGPLFSPTLNENSVEALAQFPI